MTNSLLTILRRPPIRLRITAWYVLILGVSSLVIGGLLYVELNRSLFASVDIQLKAALAQSLGMIEAEKGGSAFRNKRDVDVVVSSRNSTNFAIRLLSYSGSVADGVGAYLNGPKWPRPVAGFRTVDGRGGSWRVLTERINAKEQPRLGWIQVAEPIAYITEARNQLKTVLFFAIPIMLLLAGAGGVLLVYEGLKPISRVTATAQSISSEDLSRRIAYDGAEDELARLADTFDRMLDRLQQGFEQERRFTADASHELRTPLTALKGQIDVALARDRSAGEYHEILTSLSEESDRLIRLTNDLLLLSRIGLPGRRHELEVVNLTDLVSATAEQISPLAQSKGIELIVDEGDDAIEVLGDFDQLVRLFLNLLDNAVKYTPDNGEILITMKTSSQKTAIVAVRNTGVGFAAEHAERIFERFYRVQPDRSRDSGGSGLGLAIAHEIVKAHNGGISVASVPNEFTIFSVELPVRSSI